MVRIVVALRTMPLVPQGSDSASTGSLTGSGASVAIGAGDRFSYQLLNAVSRFQQTKPSDKELQAMVDRMKTEPLFVQFKSKQQRIII